MLQPIHQPFHFLPDRIIIFKKRSLSSHTEPLIKINPFPDIKGMIYSQARTMELSENGHAGFYLFRMIRPGIVGAFIIFRNFITGSAVQINDMFGNPKITNRFIDSSFLASVYQKLRTRTGNPANIMTFSYLKKEGFVCHS